ncbi:hypothetical protein FB99_15110 [Pantoea agglomerans]|nr:hypothetical protein FB99_15110 [Pantoea agglomerans]
MLKMNIFSVLYQRNYYELLICYLLLIIRNSGVPEQDLTMMAI